MAKLDAHSLLPGESLEHFDGGDYLTFFQEGQKDKPLILFFPGWGHLGRIAYGGGGIAPQEFLAHAFVEKGYSFLAISYPIEHPVYQQIYPSMLIHDFAEAAASIASQICQKHHLKSMIPLHWSAAGQFMTSFSLTSKAYPLCHPFSVALEATPPIILSLKQSDVVDIQANGLASMKQLYPDWKSQLSSMLDYEMDQRAYEDTFLGSIPVSLLGTPLVYSNGCLKEDLTSVIKDHCSFDFGQSPLVVSISGTSNQAPYHPIVDQATWSFINERKIYHDYLTPKLNLIKQLPNKEWADLVKSIHTFSQKMICSIDGNHFIFMGKKRAELIVQIVEESRLLVSLFLEKLENYFVNLKSSL